MLPCLLSKLDEIRTEGSCRLVQLAVLPELLDGIVAEQAEHAVSRMFAWDDMHRNQRPIDEPPDQVITVAVPKLTDRLHRL